MILDAIAIGLTAVQADGLACVACGADYLIIATPHVPMGRSVTGSQVFICVGCCPHDARRVRGGVVQ